MKNLNFFIVLMLSLFMFAACDKDDDGTIDDNDGGGSSALEIVEGTYADLHAPVETDYTTTPPTTTGEYIKFSFAEEGIVSGDDWDIAFRGSTILVNGGEARAADEPARTGQGGAYLADGILSTVETVETDRFSTDSPAGLAIPTGSSNGWYEYLGPPSHLILPLPGTVLVVRTHDGRYAKMEIISYYEGAPTPDELAEGGYESRYFTFDYAYQPNEGATTFAE